MVKECSASEVVAILLYSLVSEPRDGEREETWREEERGMLREGARLDPEWTDESSLLRYRGSQLHLGRSIPHSLTVYRTTPLKPPSPSFDSFAVSLPTAVTIKDDY